MIITRNIGGIPELLQTLVRLNDAEFMESESPIHDVETGAADACLMELPDVPQNLGDLEIVTFLERTVPGEVSHPAPVEEADSVCTDCDRISAQMDSAGRPLSRDGVRICTRAWAEALHPEGGLHPVDPDILVPAPGQGTAVILCRKDDGSTRSILRRLDHRPTRITVTVERGIQHLSGLGPLSPLGVLAELEGMQLRVRCFNLLPDGTERRIDCCIFVDYVMDDLLGMAEYLNGKRSEALFCESAMY